MEPQSGVAGCVPPFHRSQGLAAGFPSSGPGRSRGFNPGWEHDLLNRPDRDPFLPVFILDQARPQSVRARALLPATFFPKGPLPPG